MEHFSYDRMVADNRAVFGGPETCVRQLERAHEILQPSHVGLVFHFGGMKQDKVLKSMERFARLVAPALR